jgi:hypothetical protein
MAFGDRVVIAKGETVLAFHDDLDSLQAAERANGGGLRTVLSARHSQAPAPGCHEPDPLRFPAPA